MQYAPTRVRAKSVRFYISAHGYAKNAPRFTLPNKDTPKTRPVLDLDLRRERFWGRMQYAPTRIRQKRTRFHYPQLRVREKPALFYTQTVVEGHFGAYAFAPYTGT